VQFFVLLFSSESLSPKDVAKTFVTGGLANFRDWVYHLYGLALGIGNRFVQKNVARLLAFRQTTFLPNTQHAQ